MKNISEAERKYGVEYEPLEEGESYQFPRDALCFKIVSRHPFMENAWIDEEGPLLEEAAKICKDCPVRKMCLQEAIDSADRPMLEETGVWGGFLFLRGIVSRKDARTIKEDFGITAKTRRRKPPQTDS